MSFSNGFETKGKARDFIIRNLMRNNIVLVDIDPFNDIVSIPTVKGVLCCTPYFDGVEGLPIEISDQDNNIIDFYEVDLPYRNVSKNDLYKAYVKAVKEEVKKAFNLDIDIK